MPLLHGLSISALYPGHSNTSPHSAAWCTIGDNPARQNEHEPFSSQPLFMSTTRVNLWSGPRNVSTALMYSFAQRSDTCVVDEPLYAHYLHVSGAPHPGADEVMAHMPTDSSQVIKRVILGPCEQPVLFMKQMAHHLIAIDRSFLADTVNILLIRDPKQMLPSLAENLTEPNLRDTGLAMQSELYHQLCELGQDPPVLDAKQLLLNPRSRLDATLHAYRYPFSRGNVGMAGRFSSGRWNLGQILVRVGPSVHGFHALSREARSLSR